MIYGSSGLLMDITNDYGIQDSEQSRDGVFVALFTTMYGIRWR